MRKLASLFVIFGIQVFAVESRSSFFVNGIKYLIVSALYTGHVSGKCLYNSLHLCPFDAFGVYNEKKKIIQTH